MAKSYVVDGATVQCSLSKGKTSTLKVAQGRTVSISNKAQANIYDTNIQKFGYCSVPKSHNCSIKLSPTWQGGKKDVEIDGAPALMHQSTIKCLKYGGVISIKKHNQCLETDGSVLEPQKKAVSRREEEEPKERYWFDPRHGVKFDVDLPVQSVQVGPGVKLELSLGIHVPLTDGQLSVTLNPKDLSVLSISNNYGESISLKSWRGKLVIYAINFSRSLSVDIKNGSKIKYEPELRVTPFGNTGIFKVSFETPDDHKAQIELAIEPKDPDKAYETIVSYAEMANSYIYQKISVNENEVPSIYKNMMAVADISILIAKIGLACERRKAQKGFNTKYDNLKTKVNKIGASAQNTSSSTIVLGQVTLTTEALLLTVLLIFLLLLCIA